MKNFLFDILPQKYKHGEPFYKQGRYVFVVAALYFVMCVFYLIAYTVVIHVPNAFFAYGSAVLLYFVVLYLMYKNTHPLYVSSFLIAVIYFLITFTGFATGGSSSFTYVYYIIIPIFSTGLGNLRYTLSLILIISVSAFYFYMSPNTQLTLAPEDISWFYFFHFGGFFIVTMILTAVQFIFPMMDIAELEKIQKQLESSNSNLENFAYVAAHDLKSPLRTIHSFANILQKNRTELAKSEYDTHFEYILQSANKMSSMIDGILAFSKIKQNVGIKKAVNLNDIVEKTINLFDIAKQDIQVTVGKLPSIIAHDELMLILFYDIISNAIKFKKPDSIGQIDIYEESDINFLKIVIKDFGIGIHNDEIETVFDLFVKSKRNKTLDGNGIGLATCRKIMGFYGGEIEAKSEYGEFTQITLKFDKSKIK